MDAACREALAASEAEMRPGRSAGDVFAAHRRVMDAHGMKAHRLNACGYSLGAKFTPSWMDTPMFYADNPVVLAENQVYFAHMILMDSDSGHAFCLGRTSIVGRDGPEPLSRYSLAMIRR
jgi:Xaa-Pro dipeptidase